MKEFTNTSYLEDIRKKIPGYDLILELIFHSLLKVDYPTAPKKVLSIAGQSNEVQSLLAINSSMNISLVEPSEAMMQLVKEACKDSKGQENISFHTQTFEAYEAEECFDLCLCLLVLQFVEKPKTFLAKIHSLLSEKGKCILSIFSSEQLEYWRAFALARGANPAQVEKTFTEQESVMKALSPKYVETLFQEIGFSKITKVCQILSTNLWILEK